MDSILSLGIQIVLLLQGLGAWLSGPMEGITFLGNEEFFLILGPAVYWCLDASLGLRLGLSLMLSGAISNLFKLALSGPRPYWYDPRVTAYSSETSFGAPSAHAQNTVVIWGILAAWVGRAWAWIAAIVIMFLVGVSRMYLGVHFPHDVLLGWLIGAFLLWAILAWEPHISAWMKGYKPGKQALIAFGASLALILVGLILRSGLSGWETPAEWIANAAQAAPDAEAINPLSLAGLTANAGAFFGLAAGAIWSKGRGGFSAKGAGWKRLARFAVGIAVVLALWMGLKMVFPSGESWLPMALRYVRYALVGAWISGLGPALFIKIKLAERLGN